MKFKQRVIGVIAGIALIMAVIAASVGVANTLAGLDTPVGQAVSCTPSSSSGGGC